MVRPVASRGIVRIDSGLVNIRRWRLSFLDYQSFMCQEKEPRSVYDDVDTSQGQYDPGSSRNMFVGEADLPESL